jgi:hypothetical protein
MQPIGEGQSIPTASPGAHTTEHTTTVPYTTFDTSFSIVAPFEQVLSNPVATHLVSVFPPYLRSGIKRNEGRAAVSLTFTWGMTVCSMSLEILPSKVQYLALKLFGTHVEIENGFRYILQQNESRLFPENVTLQGGQREGMLELFGPWVHGAIEQCPMRRLEIQEGRDVTTCVRLRITSGCNDHAHLTVSMGFDEAFQIKEALFPSGIQRAT